MEVEIRKSITRKGWYEVAEYWDDGVTIALRYFKTKKEAERYAEIGT